MSLELRLNHAKEAVNKEIRKLQLKRNQIVEQVWKEWSREKFGEDIFIKYAKGIYYVNECRIEVRSIDEYNNISAFFYEKLPLNYFKAFMEYWLMKLHQREWSGYKYRTVQSLFIRLWNQQYQEITAKELMELLGFSLTLPVEENNHERWGFYAYILTGSYQCIPYNILNPRSESSSWRYKDNFIELFAEITGTPIQNLTKFNEGTMPPHWDIISAIKKNYERKENYNEMERKT